MAKASRMMGHIEIMNQDGDWEQFPTEEQQANLRANAELIEELGYKLICQLCNTFPNRVQIRQRYLKDTWTCDKCNTVNSAGKA
jgi:proline dehydrogenase